MKKAKTLRGAVTALGLLEASLHLRPELLPLDVQVISGRLGWRLQAIQAFKQAWPALLVPDPEAGFRCLPNLDLEVAGHPDFSYRLRTGSHGLRTSGLPAEVDVLLVGDSFTFGVGVDEQETWIAHLRALSGLDCWGLGMAGYGPQAALRLMQAEGLPLRPRLVVWQFFADDPLGASLFHQWLASGSDDYLQWEQARYNRPHPLPTDPGQASRLRGLLFRHVVLYELAKYCLGLGAYQPRRRRFATVRIAGQVLHLDLASARDWTDMTRADVRQGWALAHETLLQARDLVAEAGAKFCVVIAPLKEAVYGLELAGRLRGQQAFFGQRPGSHLARFCRQQGIPCLDLFDSLLDAARGHQVLYFQHDAHWNRSGHALAGHELYRFLVGCGLLPAHTRTGTGH